jgi:hypothetical protein
VLATGHHNRIEQRTRPLGPDHPTTAVRLGNLAVLRRLLAADDTSTDEKNP